MITDFNFKGIDNIPHSVPLTDIVNIHISSTDPKQVFIYLFGAAEPWRMEISDDTATELVTDIQLALTERDL